jgi:hypothetical protein
LQKISNKFRKEKGKRKEKEEKDPGANSGPDRKTAHGPSLLPPEPVPPSLLFSR